MNDERAVEGMEHLQRAAMEMIGAARAFLDVAEQVVNDPEQVAEVVASVGAVADVAVRSARRAANPKQPVDANWSEDQSADRVQHIRVS